MWEEEREGGIGFEPALSLRSASLPAPSLPRNSLVPPLPPPPLCGIAYSHLSLPNTDSTAKCAFAINGAASPAPLQSTTAKSRVGLCWVAKGTLQPLPLGRVLGTPAGPLVLHGHNRGPGPREQKALLPSRPTGGCCKCKIRTGSRFRWWAFLLLFVMLGSVRFYGWFCHMARIAYWRLGGIWGRPEEGRGRAGEELGWKR